MKFFQLVGEFFLLILLAIPVKLYAFGEPDFLPNGSHPRIFLTSYELSSLNTKQTSAATEWVALEAWCDEHLNDTGYDAGNVNWNGYRGSGYMQYLLNFALAYQVLKDDNPTKANSYAQYVRDILVDGVFESMSTGEEYNGLALIRCGETSDRTINADENTALGLTYGTYKLGYSNRNIAAVPIAYDWIHEAGVLSEADKLSLASMMFRWFDWTRGVRSIHNNGVLVDGIRYHEDVNGDCTGNNNCTTNTAGTKAFGYGSVINNFSGGHNFMMLLVPLATYGDHPDALNYLTAEKNILSDLIVKPLSSTTRDAGGDSTEGWNYGSSYWSTLQGLYGYFTATGENIFTNFKWPVELVEAFIHRSQSDLVNVPIYGDWTGTPLGENRRYQALPFIGITQRVFPDNTLAKAGQYFLNTAPLNSNTADLWAEMLWYNKHFQETPPSVLPLAHKEVGHGYVTSRSSWEYSPETIHFTIRLEGKLTNSHEDYDEGTITLMRGKDRLLAHQNMIANSVAANTVVFNNMNHHADNPSLIQPAIDRYENTPQLMYVSGDVTNAFKRPYKPDYAKLFRRSAVHIRPNLFIIFDQTQSNTAVSLDKDWYTQYLTLPAVDTQTKTISTTVGVSKVFVKTLLPVNGSYTLTNPAAGFWRVKFEPSTQSEFENFLHVIEATSSQQSDMSHVKGIQTTDSKMTGSYISSGSQEYIILFPNSSTIGNISGSITIPIDLVTGDQDKYILTGLQPLMKYSITYQTNSITLAEDQDGSLQATENGVLTLNFPNTQIPIINSIKVEN